MSSRDFRMQEGHVRDVTMYWHEIPGFAGRSMNWCELHVTHAWNCTAGSNPQGGRDILRMIFENQEDLVWYELGFLQARYGHIQQDDQS